jgi:DNA replication protein DnaC
MKQIQLLISDEWLLYPLKETEARDLLEIADVRYKKASTIFCSQHDVGDWHQKIGESTIADAILLQFGKCTRVRQRASSGVDFGKIPMQKCPTLWKLTSNIS